MRAMRTLGAVVGAVALGLSAVVLSPATAAAGGPEVFTDSYAEQSFECGYPIDIAGEFTYSVATRTHSPREPDVFFFHGRFSFREVWTNPDTGAWFVIRGTSAGGRRDRHPDGGQRLRVHRHPGRPAIRRRGLHGACHRPRPGRAPFPRPVRHGRELRRLPRRRRRAAPTPASTPAGTPRPHRDKHQHVIAAVHPAPGRHDRVHAGLRRVPPPSYGAEPRARCWSSCTAPERAATGPPTRSPSKRNRPSRATSPMTDGRTSVPS